MKLVIKNDITTVSIEVKIGDYQHKYIALKSEPEEIEEILNDAKSDLWNLGDKNKVNKYMRLNDSKWRDKLGINEIPNFDDIM